MPCIPKGDIKARFKTGDKPTQQDFANLIDSFVETVNGIEPDEDGNVNIPNTSQTVQKNLDEHEKVIGNSTTAGHLVLQDSIDDNAVNAITPKAVNTLKVTVEANASASEIVAQSVITLNGDVETVKKDVSTLSGRMDAFDEDCNNNTQALDAHKNVVATDTTLGHLKLQNSIDDNTTNAVTPNAVNTLLTQITKNKDDITALTINIGEDGGYIKRNTEALKKHIDTASSETEAGHVKLQNSIDNTTTTALTPAAVKPLVDEVNVIKTALDTGESAAAVDLKLTTHEAVKASGSTLGHVISVQKVTNDFNTTPTCHAVWVETNAINTKINGITDVSKDVNDLKATVESNASASEMVAESVITLNGKVETIETNAKTLDENCNANKQALTTHESVIASETDYGHVKIAHNLQDDVNTVPSSHAARVKIDALNKRIDAMPDAAKLVTTHAAIVGTDDVLGHVTLTDEYDLTSKSAITANAVMIALRSYVQQPQLDSIGRQLASMQASIQSMNTEINALKNR